MHDSYRQLFAAIAQGNAVTAETVMAKAKEENKDASAAESMRDSYQTLADALASETYKLDSMFSQAMEIGSMETIGFAHTENARMLAKLQAVSADDIKRVATLYFGDEQLTIGELIPQLLPKNAPENAQNLPSAKF